MAYGRMSTRPVWERSTINHSTMLQRDINNLLDLLVAWLRALRYFEIKVLKAYVARVAFAPILASDHASGLWLSYSGRLETTDQSSASLLSSLFTKASLDLRQGSALSSRVSCPFWQSSTEATRLPLRLYQKRKA